MEITPYILLQAYSSGIFPMAEDANSDELFWFDPEYRGVIPLDNFHISRSLSKFIRKTNLVVKVDTNFAEIIENCAKPTHNRETTWINETIQKLYNELFSMGYCHSVEVWQEDKIVGGLYGVSIGGAFFGESMFTIVDNASKLALVHLVERLRFGGYKLLDAQFMTDHLKQFGTVEVKRKNYLKLLKAALDVNNTDFFRLDGAG